MQPTCAGRAHGLSGNCAKLFAAAKSCAEEFCAAEFARRPNCAAHRPHVDRRRVVLVLDEELGRAVPPRHDVLGEAEVLRLGLGVDRPREAEVADLEVAVLVDEEVARLEVAVEHVREVDRVDAAEDLVQEVLVVLVGQGLLRVDDVVEVGVHQLGDDVHVLPLLRVRVRRREDVDEAEHVVVLEVLEDLDLAQQPLAVDDVLERLRDLLDRHRLRRLDVAARADEAVRALAHRLLDGVVRRRLELHAAHVVALEARLGHLVLLLGDLRALAGLRHRGGACGARRRDGR